MKFGVTVGDEHLVGLGIVAGDNHDVASEVVLTREVEIGQVAHVEIDENRLGGREHVTEGLLRLAGAAGGV